MVDVRVGDLFDSKAQTLVNTVNCVGVMGKGIALQFKKHFPDMFKDYAERCKRGDVRLGRPYLFKRLHRPWILNFPTKDHWRSVSRLADIAEGLRYLEERYAKWGIESLAIPPLGCGHGQLEWRVVGPILYRRMSRFEIPVELYAPFGTPAAELEAAFLKGTVEASEAVDDSSIPPAWIAIVAVLAKINKEPYHWPIGRTGFQKLAYFATELKLPAGLEFRKGSYGPFSEQVKPMLTRLVNNGLLTEERRGSMFVLEPGPTFRDALVRYRQQIKTWGPQLQRMTDLFLRMRTKDAEIAATVVFAARTLAEQKKKPSEAQVFDFVKAWKVRRRPPLVDEEVASTVRSLNILGWLDLEASESLPVPTEAI